ncbi:MAG: hypothetical protein GY696_28530, partial [Gammaproteobacteria bacterium]|nr:hypothetical protein [Gammaproteobacteria bacterium]
MSFLESEDLRRAAQTSGFWRTVAEDHRLWRKRCEDSGFLTQKLPAPRNENGPCYSRSYYKSLYLRHRKINNNWRDSGKPMEIKKLLRAHDDQEPDNNFVICLQIFGDRVFSGSSDGTLRIWSVSTNQCLHVLTGHTGPLWCCRVTEDGQNLASASVEVKIWDTDTGACGHTFQGHTEDVSCMALQGTTLVTGSEDSTVRLWDMEAGESLRVLYGHLD